MAPSPARPHLSRGLFSWSGAPYSTPSYPTRASPNKTSPASASPPSTGSLTLSRQLAQRNTSIASSVASLASTNPVSLAPRPNNFPLKPSLSP